MMRFHSRRVLTFGLSVCIGTIVFINVYHIDSWTRSAASPPWNSQSQLEMPAVAHFARAQVSPKYIETHPDGVIFPQRLAMPVHSKGTILSEPNVWPNVGDPDDDRIATQMKYVPKSLRNISETAQHASKVILIYTGMGGWAIAPGQQTFLDQQCPVNRCFITGNREFEDTADVLLFKQGVSKPSATRPPHQVWVLYLLESPYHTPGLSNFRDVFNWTATYRHDSTLVTPYEKFIPYNASVVSKPVAKNYAAGKTKKVAWFVSNCGARNGRRKVADQLAQYIQVDIYGACGPLKCPRFQSNDCFSLLNKQYKFYLAFENSNCIDYITEKFFVNGLQNDIIPIVMGARPADYRRAAPPHSFIHVEDFDSPKQLAEYLHLLDNNDDLYNEYFRWKGTGQFVNTYFWCRLCALAHDMENSPSAYSDIEEWWRGDGVCIGQQRWDEYQKRKEAG